MPTHTHTPRSQKNEISRCLSALQSLVDVHLCHATREEGGVTCGSAAPHAPPVVVAPRTNPACQGRHLSCCRLGTAITLLQGGPGVHRESLSPRCARVAQDFSESMAKVRLCTHTRTHTHKSIEPHCLAAGCELCLIPNNMPFLKIHASHPAIHDCATPR